MPGVITLEVKVPFNDIDGNLCHPYCNYIFTNESTTGVLCRLFRTEGYLKSVFINQSFEFYRCQKCIDAQVHVITEEQSRLHF